jgi:spore maturation protein CgeB
MRILCVFGKHAYGDPERGEGYEHANFLPALVDLGHEVHLFESFDRAAYRDFADLNRQFLARIEALQPDLVLAVLMHYELWTETLDLVRSRCRAVVVNWGTDDSWKYGQFARLVAPHVDLWLTTSHDALAQARRDGLGNVALTQWAANARAIAEPLPAGACRHRVTFVGSAYGNRRRWIEALARRGIEVECFGHGWPHGPVAAADIPRIVRESVISLNFGDSGLHFRGVVPYRSRQLKARVFEVPGAGGFLLTESAEHLAEYYAPGREVETFDSADELVRKIRHHLAHPEERDRIARAGHARTRREHTYVERFRAALEVAVRRGSARARTAEHDCRFGTHALDTLAARHAPTRFLSALRCALVWPATALFGRQRGPRAARRLLFELCWRLAGRRTYTAAGWPGRLFYRDS